MFEGLKHLVSFDRPPSEILRDVVDIFIVAFLIYRALLVLKGTPAMKAGVGFAIFGMLYTLAKYAELVTLMSVLSWLASSAILILVVVFQNDIKRALERVGSRSWLSTGVAAQERIVDEVVEAAKELARHRIGALICIERDANILEFVQNKGIHLDAEVTRELLVSLFLPEALNKTHDGAVLIRNLKIARAGVFFPLPKSTDVDDATLGSRHRAAIGITEETDAVVVVVSEERGTISLAFPHGLVQNVDTDSLKKALLGLVGGLPEKQTFVQRLRAGLARAAQRSTSDVALGSKSVIKSDKAVSTTGKMTPPPSVAASKSSTGKSGRHQPLGASPTPRPAATTSGRLPSAKDRTGRSGRFAAVKKDAVENGATPSPTRVSVPMPSSKDKDRKSTDEPVRASDVETAGTKASEAAERDTLESPAERERTSQPPAAEQRVSGSGDASSAGKSAPKKSETGAERRARTSVSKPMTPTELPTKPPASSGSSPNVGVPTGGVAVKGPGDS